MLKSLVKRLLVNALLRAFFAAMLWMPMAAAVLFSAARMMADGTSRSTVLWLLFGLLPILAAVVSEWLGLPRRALAQDE